jgi:CYTH domain-containing protein
MTDAVERERKFLVKTVPPRLSRFPHELIEQGYLAIESQNKGAAEVRLRRIGRRYVLTVKCGSGEARLEREIPVSDTSWKALWPLTKGRRIKKTRYRIPYHGLTIELDVYQGDARGLAVAEVEFSRDAALRRFRPPAWFGHDVTGKAMYSNSRLAANGWKHKRHLTK